MRENQQGSTSRFTGKGFVFSLDAFMAVILLITAFAFVSYSAFQEKVDPISRLDTQRQLNDTLDILDREGKLRAFDFQEIESDLNLLLSKNIEWRLKITQYEFKRGQFEKASETVLGNASVNLSEKNLVKGKRLFLSFKEDEVEYYSTAEYWAWLK